MNTTVAILFYIKRSKVNKSGECPVYVRVTVDAQRFEFSSKKMVPITKWNQEAGKLIGTASETRLINEHLNYLKTAVMDAKKSLEKRDIPITVTTLKNALYGEEEQVRTIIPIFREHNDRIKALLGTEYAPGTLVRYETSLSHTQEFLEWKYKVSDIDINKIDHAFIMDYDFYLRSVRKCANNTVVKYLKNFNKIIKICLANHWIERDPFSLYKAKVKEVERVFLTGEEVQDIINKEIKNERLSLVRDIFIFSCFTGLAYIDVKNLTPEHINIGIDGDKWIFTHRQKTESASKIPILAITQSIIDKYAESPERKIKNRLLPILSNQKMNAYLKEIATLCEIDKELTFHIARHTFATTITLTNGVPIESVSKMLGHKNLRTTQHYAKVLDKKVSDDMQILKNKFNQTVNDEKLSKIK